MKIEINTVFSSGDKAYFKHNVSETYNECEVIDVLAVNLKESNVIYNVKSLVDYTNYAVAEKDLYSSQEDIFTRVIVNEQVITTEAPQTEMYDDSSYDDSSFETVDVPTTTIEPSITPLPIGIQSVSKTTETI